VGGSRGLWEWRTRNSLFGIDRKGREKVRENKNPATRFLSCWLEWGGWGVNGWVLELNRHKRWFRRVRLNGKNRGRGENISAP